MSPPLNSSAFLGEGMWEKGRMKAECVVMLLELFFRESRLMSQEMAAPLRTQTHPVWMFKSTFLPCRKSFILSPAIPL